MVRTRRSAALLGVLLLLAGCTGKPTGGPTGPLLGVTSEAPPSSSSSAPPPPPTWKPATPAPSRPTSVLWDVVATGPTHAWAVGHESYNPEAPGNTTSIPIIDQWDGTRWTRMPLPGVTWHGSLRLVAAGSPTDVWAVGGWAGDSPQDTVTRVLHYDGSAWREVPFPPGNTPSILQITGLTVAAGHAWLVGNKLDQAIIQEWDGRSWREHRPPAECTTGGPSSGGMPNFCTITGITAFAADDIWACGNGSWTGFLGPLLFHWNGTAWRAVQVGVNEQRLTLSAISGRSSKDLWAAGDTLMGGGGPLAVHGDGTTWRVVGGLPAAELPDVAVDAAGRPWLIENFRAPSARLATYTGSWADTDLPAPPGTVGMSLKAITAVPGTQKMLAVGAADLPTTPRTLQSIILEYS